MLKSRRTTTKYSLRFWTIRRPILAGTDTSQSSSCTWTTRTCWACKSTCFFYWEEWSSLQLLSMSLGAQACKHSPSCSCLCSSAQSLCPGCPTSRPCLTHWRQPTSSQCWQSDITCSFCALMSWECQRGKTVASQWWPWSVPWFYLMASIGSSIWSGRLIGRQEGATICIDDWRHSRTRSKGSSWSGKDPKKLQ